jgi:hypothetical protein
MTDEMAKLAILVYVGIRGKAYSTELRASTRGMPHAKIRALLAELERDCQLVSWVVPPPHADCRGCWMRRRYYAKRLPVEIGQSLNISTSEKTVIQGL